MSTFIIVIHVIVCVALIFIVLLQTGKGAGMGVAFGGGASRTLFGSAGPATFLSKLTTIAAIVFMLTALSLAYLSSHRRTSSIMSDVATPKTQEAQQAPVKPEGQQVDIPVPATEPAEKR